MRTTSMRTTVAAIACMSALVACGKKDAPATDTTPSATAPKPSAVATAATATATAAKPVDPAAAVIVGADAPPFKVVDKPTAADVPATPITGSANGHKYEPKAVVFEPEGKGWRMIITDKALDKPTDFIKTGAQTIYLNLPAGKVSAGQKFTRAKAGGDGFFQIVQPEDATKTTSWNTSNSFYVEITKWDVKPYDAKGGMFQQAGTASGKVYVAHDANDMSQKRGFQDSGVAGTFTDAIVRYKGEPKF